MAKKIVAFDEREFNGPDKKAEKKGKRKNRCCSCCLAMQVFTLIIFAIAGVAGWVLGDKFTRQTLDMSLADTLGVVGGLYWKSDKDVVTHGYSNDDLDKFYLEVKRNILLKDSAEVDFNRALDAAINRFVTTSSSGSTLQSSQTAPLLFESDGAANAPASGGNSEITDIFFDMISGVLDRDNLDVERINAYPDVDEFVFNLNDKQLAAFVNRALRGVLENADKIDGLKDAAKIVKLSDVFALKQMRFTAGSETGADGKQKITATSAEVTVWLGMESAANSAVKSIMKEIGFGWAGWPIGLLSDIILPKNLYITLSIPLLGEDNQPALIINSMNAAERKRANKLINAVLKLVGGGNAYTIDSLLLDGFAANVKPMLAGVVEKMNFDKAGEGTLSIDLLDMVAKLAGGTGDAALGKGDFIYVLQALLSDKTAQLDSLIPYRYDNWYKVDNKLQYLESGGSAENKVDYEKELIGEIERAYAIDFGDESQSLGDVLKLLGISLDGSNNNNAGSSDLLNKVDSAKFKELLAAPNLDDVKLKITDRMLGASLASQMDELIKGNAGMENLTVKLVALTFIEKTDRPGHKYAMLAVDVGLRKLLDGMTGGDSFITQLTTGLMPESVLLTVTVDITRDRSVARDKVEMIINSCANTDRALQTIEKLAPSVKLDSISGEIGNMLNGMLDAMDGVLEISLVGATIKFDRELSEYIGVHGALVMPDVFTVITDMVLSEKNSDGSIKRLITPDELRAVVRDLNNPADITVAALPDDGYANFIDNEVFGKYYLKAPIGAQRITTFEKLAAYLGEFSTDKLDINGLAHDTRTIAELKPTMGGTELRALLAEKMSDNQTVGAYEIAEIATAANKLTITLKVALDRLLSGAGEINALIDAKYLATMAEFDLSEPHNFGTAQSPKYGYDVTFGIKVKNDANENVSMEKSNYDAMLKLIHKFAQTFDIDKQVREFGIILYNQMKEINKGLTGTDDGEDFFAFTADGLQLVDFYSFLMHRIGSAEFKRENHTPDDLKAALQGLYPRNPNKVNLNNLNLGDIIKNPPSENGKVPWSEEKATREFLGTHIDRDFNGFLLYSLQKAGAVVAEQTIILAKGDNNSKTLRDWLNGKLGFGATDANRITPDNDYLVLTMSMKLAAFFGGAGSNNAKSLIPGDIHATVVYRYDSATKRFSAVNSGSSAALIFNNMSKEQFGIITSLLGLERAGVDEFVNTGAEALNTVKHYQSGSVSVDTKITFSPVTGNESGYGKITISDPSVSRA